jgi:hypothetical protein
VFHAYFVEGKNVSAAIPQQMADCRQSIATLFCQLFSIAPLEFWHGQNWKF